MEDFGAQGEWPIHPELLDWLAVEFRESGWDVKHMVRLMVTSADLPAGFAACGRSCARSTRTTGCWRRRRRAGSRPSSSATTPWPSPACSTSTSAARASSPYQPAGYYANLQFPDRDYVADADDRQYRRGLYMHWQRTFLHPMLANFDAPAARSALHAATSPTRRSRR